MVDPLDPKSAFFSSGFWRGGALQIQREGGGGVVPEICSKGRAPLGFARGEDAVYSRVSGPNATGNMLNPSA